MVFPLIIHRLQKRIMRQDGQGRGGGSEKIKLHPRGKDGCGENPVFFKIPLDKRNCFSLLPLHFSLDLASLGYLTSFMSGQLDISLPGNKI